MKYTRIWLGFIVVMVGSFAVLGYYGSEIYRKSPSIPEKVVSASGQVLFTGQDIKDGQNVWQSMGGQEVGSIWGHGAYQAPDWTAEWLHKEAVHLLDTWIKAYKWPIYCFIAVAFWNLMGAGIFGFVINPPIAL